MSDEIHDWTYKEHRWRYRCTLRPASIGAVPPGRIIGADKPPAYPGKRFDHGTIEYARPLTEYEQKHFDLVLVAETSDDGTWSDWEKIERGEVQP
ncbi:MAG: defense against restriction DarA-related protein [Chloroflexota bacterium]